MLDEVREPRRQTPHSSSAAPRTGNPLSDNTLGKALRTAKIPATIHGMRASLRDWLAAEGVPYELAEAVLAHQPRGIAKSYRRDDLLEARRPIMERWALHVSDPGNSQAPTLSGGHPTRNEAMESTGPRI